MKANLYNYDPALLDFDSKTNRVGKELQWWVHLATKSHIASFYQGKLITVQSLYDSSDERRKPEVMNDWYKCTARWSEKEAIDTTIAILRNLGDTGRLAEALRAPVEYRAPELTLKAPDGTKSLPFGDKVSYSNTGASYTASRNITVSGQGCAVPAQNQINICSPAQNANTTSPVQFTAQTNTANFTLNRIYVDNVAVYQVQSQNVSTSLSLSLCTHNIVLVSYNSQGQAFTASRSITVH